MYARYANKVTTSTTCIELEPSVQSAWKLKVYHKKKRSRGMSNNVQIMQTSFKHSFSHSITMCASIGTPRAIPPNQANIADSTEKFRLRQILIPCFRTFYHYLYTTQNQPKKSHCPLDNKLYKYSQRYILIIDFVFAVYWWLV